MNSMKLAELIAASELHGPTVTQPAVVVKSISTAEEFSLNADLPFYPACMIKVPLAVAWYVAIDRGRARETDQLEVREEHITDTVPPAPYKVGMHDSIANFIHYALRYSDNVATNVLFDNIDRSYATEVLHGLGFMNTYLRRKLSGGSIIPDAKATGRNEHTARDAAKILGMIAQKSLPYSDIIANHLRLPEPDQMGFQRGDDVWYKNGYTEEVHHFAAVVHTQDTSPFVVAAFTGMPYNGESVRKMLRFANDVRSVLSSTAT